jgi:hypothetical protein
VSISYTRWRAQLLTNKGGIFLKIVDQFTNTTRQQKDNGEFLLKYMWIEDWSNNPRAFIRKFHHHSAQIGASKQGRISIKIGIFRIERG